MPTVTDQPRQPQLGQPVPDFAGHSTLGAVKRDDFAGRWLVFFSHPADFTPVCTTEFVAFARLQPEFRAVNCGLLGLSSDSVETHAAWCDHICREFGVRIDFPILADVGLDIARRYGMVSAAGAQAVDVRALLVIDPRGVLRATLYYPCATGRSVTEVLRLVQALQEADKKAAVTPEGWQPGDPTLAVPSVESVVATGRRDGDFGCVDWYVYRPAAQGDARPVIEPLAETPSPPTELGSTTRH